MNTIFLLLEYRIQLIVIKTIYNRLRLKLVSYDDNTFTASIS